MRSRYHWIIFCLLLSWVNPSVRAAVYKLVDGESLIGEPSSYTKNDLILRKSDGSAPTRIPWEKFSDESLKLLQAEAKSATDKSYIQPFLEETVEKETQRKEIIIKQVPPPERPVGRLGFFAAFSSPVFLIIFLLIYAANIYAGYEIAFFKNLPPILVCSVAAVAPWIGPIVFLCLPGKPDPMAIVDQKVDAVEIPLEEAGVPAETAPPQVAATSVDAPPLNQPTATPAPRSPLHLAPQVEAAPAAVATPAPITFHRGEFSFNRRFFETKLAGFFRVVPGEAEKDMVVRIKSLRGDFIGKRITRVTQAELYLQVFKDNATHDEMIPFTEVQEVSIQHKDA